VGVAGIEVNEPLETAAESMRKESFTFPALLANGSDGNPVDTRFPPLLATKPPQKSPILLTRPGISKDGRCREMATCLYGTKPILFSALPQRLGASAVILFFSVLSP
jgi:hypothetical protein